MKTEIMTKATRAFHKVGFKIQKHSPEILLVTGIVGVVGSAVMACRATTKVNDILEDTKHQVDTINEVAENPEMSEKYSSEDRDKDLTIVYTQTAVKFAKLYGPSIILGATSIACILAGHNIIKKRYVGLSAAYATLDKGFKEYRRRVVDRFGEEVDYELRHNVKAQEIEEKVVDEEGNETTVTKTVNAADPNGISDYARFFDDGCLGWEKDAEHNLYVVKAQQARANDILKSRGHLFLNEVYEMFGIPHTKAGQVVGWIYDENNPNVDNFVDFGIFDANNEAKRDFVNGYERSILLDFNVDGNIWDLLN